MFFSPHVLLFNYLQIPLPASYMSLFPSRNTMVVTAAKLIYQCPGT